VFFNEEDAILFASVLENNGIPCQVKRRGYESTDYLWANLSGKESLVNVRQQDVEAAAAIMKELAEESADDNQGMLSGMTDSELWEVLVKEEEWNEEEVVIARRMMEKRGLVIKEEHLEKARSAHIAEKFKPERISTLWIVVGYLFCIVSPMIGILIALGLSRSKKTLPDGKRTYVYAESDRKHGIYMIWTSIGIFVLFALFYLVAKPG
jgi:hypothetical protein